MAPKNAKNHWAFLEEIEAPMWVDLTVEAKSSYGEIDDRWFHTTHQFHHLSSRPLKAAFANASEESLLSEFDLKGSPAAKLPSSVSRSRGKHYSSKKWIGDGYDPLLNKQHTVQFLNGKSSCANKGSGDGIKPKVSFVNSKETSKSKISLVCERGLTGTSNENGMKPKSSCRGSYQSSSSVVDKAGESNASTVTSENDQVRQQRNLEVSSQAFVITSRLLSSLRISLRKSCSTRPASRIEMNGESKQSRDRNSYGKSSIGFNSNSSEVVLMQRKEQTSDGRNVAKMTKAEKQNAKDSNLSKVYYARVKDCNSRKAGVASNVTKSSLPQDAKSKVQAHNLRPKDLQPQGVNNQGLSTGIAKAKKAKVGGPNRLLGTGKENVKRRLPVNQKSSGWGARKGGKLCGPQISNTAGLFNPELETNVLELTEDLLRETRAVETAFLISASVGNCGSLSLIVESATNFQRTTFCKVLIKVVRNVKDSVKDLLLEYEHDILQLQNGEIHEDPLIQFTKAFMSKLPNIQDQGMISTAATILVSEKIEELKAYPSFIQVGLAVIACYSKSESAFEAVKTYVEPILKASLTPREEGDTEKLEETIFSAKLKALTRLVKCGEGEAGDFTWGHEKD